MLTHAIPSTSRALSVGAALALLLTACGDDPSSGPPVDACNNSCIPELGEACNPVTARCEIVTPDADPDAGDRGPDTPDVNDEPDLALGCEDDDGCDSDEYCSAQNRCVGGCRDNPDNCDDCDLFPGTCDDGLACSPVDHQCVSDCFRDSDCEFTQFCEISSGLCQRGCRDNPDNCPDTTGDEAFACNLATRQCIGGSCGVDTGCPDGAYCSSGRCIWGCRVGGTDCGTGQVCDAQSRECVALDCACAPSASDQECDALCDENGQISALYCDRDGGVCTFGCRVFDDDTDNCRPGTLCDETSRACIDGCRDDVTCPFGTYCDEGLCAPGCKAGECPPAQFCDLEARACVSLDCTLDTNCPEGAYCAASGCQDGCRVDDPITASIDEDTCFGDLLCSPASHTCIVPLCASHADCPLGQVCLSTVCVSGCAGLDNRCPAGQPCSTQTQQCGCLREADCPNNTHCSAPTCEVDCVPDNPATAGVDEDTCTDPLNCDPASGRCRAGCIDTAEDIFRNDFPGDAYCAYFSTADLSDANQARLCNGYEIQPPDSFCSGEDGTWCQSGVACTGQDEDWYTFFFYAGDEVSAFVSYPGAGTGRVFVMVLTHEDNPIQVVRGATPSAEGLAFEGFRITQSGQYFLRVYASDPQPVPYDLRLEVDRLFFCREDIYDPANDNPSLAAPTLLTQADSVSIDGLSVCGGDRDFYAVELFTGNVFTAAVDPTQEEELLTLALGLPNAGRDDLTTPIGFGLLDDTTEDANDVLLQIASVPSTNAYYVRVASSDPEAETLYSLDLTRAQGSAVCPDDTFEPNDNLTEEATHNRNRWRIVATSGAVEFSNARLCPAPEGGASDVDLYRVEVTRPDLGGGFLSASLSQNAPPLVQVEILDDSLDPLATTPGSMPTGQVTTASPLAGATTYFVRVTGFVDDSALPWQGGAYSLRLEYTNSSCDPDALEDNDAAVRASALHATLLLGTGDECGSRGFTAGRCLGDVIGASPLCLCDTTTALRLCQADDDWFRFAMLVGDTYTVRLTPTSPSDLARMRSVLFPPNCAPGDELCDDAIFLGTSPDGSSLQSPPIDVNPLAGNATVVLQNFLLVGHRSGANVDYQITVEVQAEISRTCDPDLWDEENLANYPGPNDIASPPTPGCVESSCTLTLDGANNTRLGRLCYWDQQDWFRFTVPPDADRLVLLEFTEDEGRMEGELFQILGGGTVLVDPLLLRPNNHGEPAGFDRVFYDLDAGTYQIKVHMPSAIGGLVGSTTPNDYDITLRQAFCGEGVWSNDEECDQFAPVAASVMCGTGGSCSACTCD